MLEVAKVYYFQGKVSISKPTKYMTDLIIYTHNIQRFNYKRGS